MKGNIQGTIIFGSGSVYGGGGCEYLKVSKEENNEDYEKISKWISNLDK